MKQAYIIDICRTPRGIGKSGKGALSHLHPSYLAATVLAALAERNDFDTADVDDIIWGTSTQVKKQSCDLARMAALTANYNIKASGVTLDRFCGSGITSVNLAAAQIMSGMEDLVIAGGTEMMSYTMSVADSKVPPMLDQGNMVLRGIHPQSQQGVCADVIATLEGINRETLDQFGSESQAKAHKAINEGRFDGSVISVKNPDGSVALDREEFPRPGTTREKLSQFDPVFKFWADIPIDGNGTTYLDLILKRYPHLGPINFVHHAGTSSGIVDGAAAILLASNDYLIANKLQPRARIVATANMGDCPTLMLNAPVPAAQKVLNKAKLSTGDIDVWEINEAFAVVAEKFIRDLKLDRTKVNINGGAIALGHPVGATGSILIGMALDELERQNGRFGLITMCAAGGMAPAIIIEKL